MKVALLFIAGLFLSTFFPYCNVLIPAFLFYTALLAIRFTPGLRSMVQVRVGYWFSILFFVVIGFLRMDPAKLEVPKNTSDKHQIVVGKVLTVEPGKGRQKHLVEILHMEGMIPYPHQANKIFFYGPKGKHSNLTRGDVFIFKNTIYPVEIPDNPHQFNYRKYLLERGTFGQSFENNFTRSVLLKNTYSKGVYREKLLKILHSHIKDPYAASVCGAILFGQKDGLESEQLDLFRKSGVAHVMAVSGMHVGIIFGLAWMLLGRLPSKTPNQKIVRLSLALSCIWGFIGITGFPPSAVRAGVMFSFILTGKALYLHTNSLNLLAASALLMLMYQPNWIFDVGFQFSYFAVAGIILTYPPINRIISSPLKPIRWAWSLISISLAAQLFLLPLSVFYFYGFSPLFWLNGIPAAVLASATMSFSILIISFSSISTSISDFIGLILEKIIFAFDSWLHYISLYKFSYLGDIGLSEWALLLFLLYSLSVIFLLAKPLAPLLMISCSLLIAINVSNLTIKKDQKILSPLYTKDGTHIYIEDGNECACISTLKKSDNSWEYAVHGFEVKQHLTHCHIINIFEYRPFYSFPKANILSVHDYMKIEPNHLKHATIVLWWCEEDPIPHLKMMPNAEAIFVRKQAFNQLSTSDLQFFADRKIRILAPGDPYFLK